MEAYVHGVSTRNVDDLMEAMGAESGISKSEVSRICAGLDEVVGAFRTRTLDHVEFPYVYLDATYLHVRNTTSQVVSMAVVVATGVTATGQREILGLDVGDSEDEVFWKGFLTSLKQRGLAGVRLVISDHAPDSWRRCAVVSRAPRISGAGAILIDMHDEWSAGDRRYLSEGSMAKLYETSDTDPVAAIDSGE